MNYDEINVEEIGGEHLEKMLKEIGMTKEQFKDSNLKFLLQAMIGSTEEAIQDGTKELMKEHSLSYGEARIIATEKVLSEVKTMMKGD